MNPRFLFHHPDRSKTVLEIKTSRSTRFATIFFRNLRSVRRMRRISRGTIPNFRKSNASTRISFLLLDLSSLSRFFLLSFLRPRHSFLHGENLYRSFAPLDILRNLPWSELYRRIQNMRMPHRLISLPAVVRNPPTIFTPSPVAIFLAFPSVLSTFVRDVSFPLGVSEFPLVDLHRLLKLPNRSIPITVFAPRQIPLDNVLKESPHRTRRVSIFARYATIRQIGIDIGIRIPPINSPAANSLVELLSPFSVNSTCPSDWSP